MEFEIDLMTFKEITFRCQDVRIEGVTKSVIVTNLQGFTCDGTGKAVVEHSIKVLMV